MTYWLFINTLLLIALLVQRRRAQRRNLQSLNQIERATMSLVDQVKDLTDKIGTIEENTANLGTATQLISEDVTALKRELEEANAKTNLDLAPLIARAGNIGTAIGEVNTLLRSVAGTQAGSDPANPPGEGENGTDTNPDQ
jgi:hypothetical protein